MHAALGGIDSEITMIMCTICFYCPLCPDVLLGELLLLRAAADGQTATRDAERQCTNLFATHIAPKRNCWQQRIATGQV